MKAWNNNNNNNNNNRIRFGVADTIFEEENADADADADDGEVARAEREVKKKQQQQLQLQLHEVEEDLDTDDDDDDDDDDDISLPPLQSPPLSPLSCAPDLDTIVQAWSVASGKRPDVKIHVDGTCFHLHREVLSSASAYLNRLLTQLSEVTLPASLKITSSTFNLIAESCYSNHHLTLTPSNVAALRTAAEALEMAGSAGIGSGRESLRQKTESFFCQFVLPNRDFALTVFRSCLSLLPEAEETAFLASRCLEVLCSPLAAAEDGGWRFGVGEGMKIIQPEDFLVIAESMHRRFTRSHDLLYTVIDLYLKVYDGKMSEQQRTRICCSVDCNILSSQLLLQAVKNPRMPLRFVVQAMLMEQLNTHRSIWTNSAAAAATTTTNNITNQAKVVRDNGPPSSSQDQDAPSLGAILQRDAALRQVALLKSAINTTTSRISSLENELSSMKKLLVESERRGRGAGDSTSSASFRFDGTDKKIGRGGRGSISSGNLISYQPAFVEGGNPDPETAWLKKKKKDNLGRRLIKGLKSVFRVSSTHSDTTSDETAL